LGIDGAVVGLLAVARMHGRLIANRLHKFDELDLRFAVNRSRVFVTIFRWAFDDLE
jgi:hypothetical protein